MKIELLNDTKLKITFTCIELSENHISLHSFLSNTTLANTFIDSLINIAKEKLNFNYQNQHIKSEIYFLNNTHFTIYITIDNKNFLLKQNVNNSLNSTFASTDYGFVFNSKNKYIDFLKRHKLDQYNPNIIINLYLYRKLYFLLIHIKNLPLERTKKMQISFLDETAPYFTSNIIISKIKEFSESILF